MSAPPRFEAVALVGPTGVGKTAISLALARRLDAEIVCCDSRQLYRGLDRATGKPTPEERRLVPHHLYDVLEPTERASAGRYERHAAAVLADLAERRRRPLVVGGTGFYLEALRFGLPAIPPIPPALRAAVRRELEDRGVESLHAELGERDPVAAARIPPGDHQRVARAVEVVRATGVPFSRWLAVPAESRRSPRCALRVFVLARARAALYRDLDRRTEEFFAGGLLEEVRELLARGVPATAPAFRSLAYRQALSVVLGERPLAAAVEQARLETRRYAKRQLTWWRGRGRADVEWFAVDGLAPEETAHRLAERIAAGDAALP